MERSEIDHFRADLAGMDGPLVRLLSSYFRARGPSWAKLYHIGTLARPDHEGSVPSWACWYRDVPRSRQPVLVEELAEVLQQEVADRDRAELDAQRERSNTIVPRDAEGLSDGELSAILLVLTAPADTLEARWLLLAELAGLGRGGLRAPTWPRWRRIALGPEPARAAATGSLAFEARRRGLRIEQQSAITPDRDAIEPTDTRADEGGGPALPSP